VLVDEADVFLAKRSGDDLVRNAFVAIFLRLLEYYQGIMFLTTNRVQDFDDAFQSRIDLRLEYDPLDERQRAVIWATALSAAQKKTRISIIDQSAITQLAEQLGKDLDVNGREIKNLVKLAIAIAEDSDRPVTKEDFTQIYNISYKPRSIRDHVPQE
jgi:hypothetical protein